MDDFREVIKHQIGKKPKGTIKVVKLCRYGFPQVIENSLLVGGKPMPTLFWLTCPFLVKEVSRLEEAGYIEYFEEKIKRDARFRGKYFKAHSWERMLRKIKLPDNIPSRIKFKLLSTGVGGIENPLGVKCLHLHLASFFGGIPNPVGKEVFKKFLKGVENCKNGYCNSFVKTEPKGS